MGHPETARRLTAINDALIESRLMPFLDVVDVERATDEQLLRVHDRAHLERLRSLEPGEGFVQIDPDTYLHRNTLLAAEYAAGAVATACDLVFGGRATNAFCAVRPPGHHATRREAMGFCFYNNVAVGVAQALSVHGAERVAIVDFDVHQGNGTLDIFGDDERVLYCSTFQHPFYPVLEPSVAGRGVADAPLSAGSGGELFRRTVEENWLPALDRFRPDMIFASAGFDAHQRDHLADLDLHESDYAWLTERIVAVAGRHCGGRVVSVLEGGYDSVALGASVVAHVRALMGL